MLKTESHNHSYFCKIFYVRSFYEERKMYQKLTCVKSLKTGIENTAECDSINDLDVTPNHHAQILSSK